MKNGRGWTKKLTDLHKKYSKYVQISFIFDKTGLLGYKDAPIDRRTGNIYSIVGKENNDIMNKYSQEEIEFSFNGIMTLYRLQQYKKEKEKNELLLRRATVVGKFLISI